MTAYPRKVACRIKGCAGRMPERGLMCHECWIALPKDLLDALRQAERPLTAARAQGRRPTIAQQANYMEARQACIDDAELRATGQGRMAI